MAYLSQVGEEIGAKGSKTQKQPSSIDTWNLNRTEQFKWMRFFSLKKKTFSNINKNFIQQRTITNH